MAILLPAVGLFSEGLGHDFTYRWGVFKQNHMDFSKARQLSAKGRAAAAEAWTSKARLAWFRPRPVGFLGRLEDLAWLRVFLIRLSASFLAWLDL